MAKVNLKTNDSILSFKRAKCDAISDVEAYHVRGMPGNGVSPSGAHCIFGACDASMVSSNGNEVPSLGF